MDSSPVSEELDSLFKVNSIEYFKSCNITEDKDLDVLVKQIIRVENNTAKKDGLSYLLKILENVLLDPSNLKTRRIRRSNSVFMKYISQNELFLSLFICFGFVTVDEFYVLQEVDFYRLLYAYKELMDSFFKSFGVKYKSMEPHFFDPFKSYKHNSNIHANSEFFELVSRDETKRSIYHTVKEISEHVESGGSLEEWNPVISFEVSRPVSKRTQTEASDSFKPPTSAIVKMYNIGKNENFESRSKKELETLRSKSEFAKKSPVVEIKIKFPKLATLKVQVPVKSLVGNIRRGVQSILLDEVGFHDWQLVEFPLKRYIRDDKTLLEQDILTNSVLHFNFKDSKRVVNQVIKQEYVEKYKV